MDFEQRDEPLPARYNVDFFIKVNEKFIGLQIKPVNAGIQLHEIFKEHSIQLKSHEQFLQKFGGRVFYIFSVKKGDKKEILNTDIIDEIKEEIVRLS